MAEPPVSCTELSSSRRRVGGAGTPDKERGWKRDFPVLLSERDLRRAYACLLAKPLTSAFGRDIRAQPGFLCRSHSKAFLTSTRSADAESVTSTIGVQSPAIGTLTGDLQRAHKDGLAAWVSTR